MISNRALKQCFHFMLAFILLITFSSLMLNTLRNTNIRPFNFKFFTNNESERECNPYVYNSTHFSVNINGVSYPKRIPLYEQTSINFTCLNSFETTKRILMWNKFNGLPNIPYEFGVRRPFELLNCPVTNCELTNDRSKLTSSDLVLFHLRNQIDAMPKQTNARQRFVHVIFESPVHCHMCAKYEKAFNLTAGYSTHSDYMSQYWTDSGLYWELNANFTVDNDFQAGKTAFASTLISNCGSKFRNDYISELKKHVNISVYGKCGKSVTGLCGKESMTKQDCREYFSQKYLFFLAFENTVCNDYITEKFFDTLKYDIVVVVLGGGNYAHYVPKSAYINARDFKTPKHLATYLKYLSKNKTAYNEFFKWKKYVRVYKENHNMRGSILPSATVEYERGKVVLAGFLCEMCIQLQLESRQRGGGVKSKRVDSLVGMYGLKENCYGSLPGSFELVKGLNLVHSFFMSPE